MFKKSLWVLFVCCSLLLGAVSADCESKPQVLTIAMSEEIESADIQQVFWDNLVHWLLYDSLVAFDLENKTITPATASEFTVSADGKTLTYKIPPGLQFSNGAPLTATEYKASLDRYIKISPYASDFSGVTFSAPDAATLVMNLAHPTDYLRSVITSVYTGAVSVKDAEKMGKEKFSEKPVANGPLYVKEWLRGSHITLARNPHFKTMNPSVDNKGPYKLETVKIRMIPDKFTRTNELLSGSVDLIVDVPMENIDQLKRDKNIQVLSYMQPGIDMIMLNPAVAPFTDAAVRKAMAMAVNRDEVALALKGTVSPVRGLISPAQLLFDPQTEADLGKALPFDVTLAKQVLAQAGWTDGNGDGIVEKDGKTLTATLMVPFDYPALKQIGPVIQAQMKKIGFNLQLREYDLPHIKQAMREQKYEAALRLTKWLDPDILTYIFGSVGKIYANPEYDKLLDEQRALSDVAARTAKFDEITKKIVVEDGIAIPMFSEYRYLAARKSVKDIKVSKSGMVYLNDTHIE